jgi:NTP pyrophosphatase (non-canonical NTP hydrolase)
MARIDGEKLTELVTAWGDERGITKPQNVKTQIIKLIEEVGELAQGINKVEANPEYIDQIKDSIGDIQVVLIILSRQLDIEYDECLFEAYKVIKNRKGKTTEDGAFVKEEDL